jgi:hypothetical protein
MRTHDRTLEEYSARNAKRAPAVMRVAFEQRLLENDQ